MTTPKTRPARRRTPQLGMSIPASVDTRARAAFRDATHREAPTYSTFLVGAVLAHVARLEAEHHGGQPWPPATSAQTRHAGIGRGQISGIKKTTVSSYPSKAEAARIRGTAVGMKMSLSELITAGIEARLDELDDGTTVEEAEPGSGPRGRPIGPGKAG